MGGESRCNTAVGGESSALDHVRDIINSPAPCSNGRRERKSEQISDGAL